MSEDAFTRLQQLQQNPIEEYSYEEMANQPCVTSDETLTLLSEDALQEIDNLSENVPPITEETSNEVLFKDKEVTQNETKPRKRAGRPSKKVVEKVETTPVEENVSQSFSMEPLLNQLVRNFIAEIESSNVKMKGFDDNAMRVIYDYMRKKFQ